MLDALSEDRTGDAARLLASPTHEVDGFGEVDDPPIKGVEGDSFDHPRLWLCWNTHEWRTDYPPPPGFDGPEQGEWDEAGYWRSPTHDEHAALVAAGIAEDSTVTLEQDEADRAAFFAGLAAERA